MIYVIPRFAQVYELIPSGANVYSVMLHDGYTIHEDGEIGWCRRVLPLVEARKFIEDPNDGYWFGG